MLIGYNCAAGQAALALSNLINVNRDYPARSESDWVSRERRFQAVFQAGFARRNP